MYLRTYGILSPQITLKIGSANRKKMRKLSDLRKVRKCNKLFKFASLLIYDLRNFRFLLVK
jgi:hypothetical protein